MRIWSLHPKYLDAKGLVALWRETLLARNVLENKTKGQVQYEFDHLLGKLKTRDHERYILFSKIEEPDLHPLFFKVEGTLENWENLLKTRINALSLIEIKYL